MSLTPLSFLLFLCHRRDPGSAESLLWRILLLHHSDCDLLQVKLQVMWSLLQRCLPFLILTVSFFIPYSFQYGVTGPSVGVLVPVGELPQWSCSGFSLGEEWGDTDKELFPSWSLSRLGTEKGDKIRIRDTVVLLNTCSASYRGHGLYPFFTGYLSVTIHCSILPGKLATEQQKFPLL